jgi:hypothetical protein
MGRKAAGCLPHHSQSIVKGCNQMVNQAKVKSAIVELKKKLSQKNVSEDDLWDLKDEFHDYFNEMSNVQRVTILKRFWKLDYEFTTVDKATNCLYGSSPLFRAFTISHDQLSRQHQIEHGKSTSCSEELSATAEDLKRDIASIIKKCRGEVKTDDGPVLRYEDNTEPEFDFYGFQPGLASDDYVIGMFFSEADRAKAVQDIVKKWGQWGVRTEPLAEERTVHAKRHWYWKKHFDRKKFRRKFAKMSHQERLDAIEELNAKGIDFKFTDPASYEYYQSQWHNQGGVQNSRCFSYSFDLGYLPEDYNPFELPEDFPSAQERRQEIDEIERTLLHLIAKHGGLVTSIKRSFSEAVLSVQDSETFMGYGCINARFPNHQARRDASSEIHERLSITGVHFSVDEGEQLSIDEQIAKTNQELDEKRKDLDWRWSQLEYAKQGLSEEVIRIEENERKLLEEEVRFKELEKSISDRLQQLSQQRDSFRDNLKASK